MIRLLMERNYATWRTNWNTADGLTVVPGFIQVQEHHVSPCKDVSTGKHIFHVYNTNARMCRNSTEQTTK